MAAINHLQRRDFSGDAVCCNISSLLLSEDIDDGDPPAAKAGCGAATPRRTSIRP
jgi:hypothetical protein